MCFYSEENYFNLLLDREQISAILDFTHNAMSWSIFRTYHLVGRSKKSHGRHQNYESATILKKIISIYCLTLNIWRPSWILPTMQCPKVRSGHTTMSGLSENTMVDISIYCLTLNIWRPSWILPTMQCPKVRSGHTTMSGLSENTMVDTKIKKNLPLFWRKWYQCIVWHWTYNGHLVHYP